MKAEDIYVIQPENEEQANALKAFIKALKMKFEITKVKAYSPEFLEKIKNSKLQHSQGKDKVIKTEDLWK
ncbi:DUF2683 family protein [Crocinitomix catalasitica]|uniref:DUF2683 family protein n=1 Tax=Crocinitomix catalasitica TaxID=184607 RepID=UPI00055B3942|nr:DUF2683 family protein [Crocinitomix catalasitica]